MSFMDDFQEEFRPSKALSAYKTKAEANRAAVATIDAHLLKFFKDFINPLSRYYMLRHDGTAVLCQQYGWHQE